MHSPPRREGWEIGDKPLSCPLHRLVPNLKSQTSNLKKQVPRATRMNQQDSTAATKGRYAFISLGCPKNLVDSERMLGLFQLEGYQLVEEPEGADFVVVNTCGFIEQAREESYAAIDEMLRLKREGKTRGVIVSGCLAERQKEQLLEERPEIDSLVGVFGREQVAEVADRLLGDLEEQRLVFRPAPVRALVGRRSLADHASPFRLPENLRGLRSIVHVLCDSSNAWQACQQIDRKYCGRSTAVGS